MVVTLLSALWAHEAVAGDVAVSGRVGYLSEWEITATARATSAGRRTEFVGPLVMKHTGACMPSGFVEKPGEIRFWRTGVFSAGIQGVLSVGDERCAFEARQGTGEGLLRCPGKGGVPLSLTVDREAR